MQATSPSGSSGKQPSALLHCLSQLKSDVCEQVALPKLIEHGSAAAVALSCSQLRDLCYSSRQSLNLGRLLDRTDLWCLRSLVQILPLHFPNCLEVSLELPSALSYQNMPYLLPALARLSDMTGVSLKLGDEFQQPPAWATVYSMHAQLPSLRELTLTIQCLEDWVKAEHVHRELGALTQLTRLCLTLDNMNVWDPLPYAAAQHLSGLKQLQHLSIWADWDGLRSRYEDELHGFAVLPVQLLSAITCLMRLESNVFNLDIAGLSSCVKLEHLAVCTARRSFWLAPVDWAGLAQLTRLTELRLLNGALRDVRPKACAALSKLTGLQVAAAYSWHVAFLPALTACVRLTEIFGLWYPLPSSERPALTLPQVLVLNSPTEGDAGCYECFPNVCRLREEALVDGTQHLYNYAMAPSHLCALCKHCTGLRDLVLTAENGSLDPATPQADCVAAIQSLTALQHLTRLDFTVFDNVQFLALVRACSVLEGHSLQVLQLTEGYNSAVTAGGWMQLSALRRLRKLSAAVSSKASYDVLVTEAVTFLGALSASGCGVFCLELSESTAPFESALAALQMVGLQPPRVELVRKRLNSFVDGLL